MSKRKYESSEIPTTNENLMKLMKKLCEGLDDIDIILLQKDIENLSDDFENCFFNEQNDIRPIKKRKIESNIIIDEIASKCANKSYINPQWAVLAGRIIVWNISKIVPKTFSESTELAKNILHSEYYDFVIKNNTELNNMIISENDNRFNLFSIKSLLKTYLSHIKVDNKIIVNETPQYMYLRVATYLWYPNLAKIKEIYILLSEGKISPPSPVLFNSGMKRPQLASCVLMKVPDDLGGIARTWTISAFLSKYGAGMGIGFTDVRHSQIAQSGSSKGVIQWLRIQDRILDTVDQGGKRKGSGTVYLDVWHKDIFAFVNAFDEGPEDTRAKDLFYGLMICDLFMKRVEIDGKWTLFCPNIASKLKDTWGDEFEKYYISYENDSTIDKQTIKARELWFAILTMQIKKGMPFMIYSDSVNKKSNQKHIGTIKCSNLCTEIMEYTSDKEVASCNLTSIPLNSCVVTRDSFPVFNFEILEKLVAQAVRNINQAIDRTYYPDEIPELKYANLRHRYAGIGVQGLDDTFKLLDISWVIENCDIEDKYKDSWQSSLTINPVARKLNRDIFETIYYCAVKESCLIAKERGKSYDSFPGSPASQGILQCDMWDDDNYSKINGRYTGRYSNSQWCDLRKMMKEGMSNSLLVAPMPTATSAYILDNTESFEPCGDLISTRTVLSGQYLLTNKHLVKDLKSINLWNTDTVRQIIKDKGSIQNMGNITNLSDGNQKRFDYLKLKYKTIFEIPMNIQLQMMADRAMFIDQSGSFNAHMSKPTFTSLTSFHFNAWKKGLKTGMYYFRSKLEETALNFSLDNVVIPKKYQDKNGNDILCTDEVCINCSS